MEYPRLLRRAIALAEQNPHKQWKLGAVVARGSKPLAYGMNTERNDVKQVPYTECGVHAEIATLRQVSDPERTRLYVARVGRDGKIRMARPCRRCWIAIREAGVKSVCYTTTEGFAHEYVSGTRAERRALESPQHP